MEAEDESLGKLCGMQATASRRANRALPNMRGVMVYSLSADSLSQWKEGHISVRETSRWLPGLPSAGNQPGDDGYVQSARNS